MYSRCGLRAIVAVSFCLFWMGATFLRAQEIEPSTDLPFSLPRETGAIGTIFLEMAQKYNSVGADIELGARGEALYAATFTYEYSDSVLLKTQLHRYGKNIWREKERDTVCALRFLEFRIKMNYMLGICYSATMSSCDNT